MSLYFGNKLKQIRLAQNITQIEIASTLKITKGTVSKWESGKLEPNIECLKQLAAFLNVTTDELLDYNISDYTF